MKIAGIILGFIGVLALALGGTLFVKEQLFLQRAEPATAVVTENKLYTYTGQVNEYGVQHYYCSEFQFQTKDGRSISFEEPNCAQLEEPPDYQVGQKVAVVYDPNDPGDSVQMGQFSYSNAEAASGAGAFFVLLGLGLFWAGLLRGRKAAASR
ncbi:MAG: DUF3592 domain-containing protein [Anaerolineales bacterium]